MCVSTCSLSAEFHIAAAASIAVVVVAVVVDDVAGRISVVQLLPSFFFEDLCCTGVGRRRHRNYLRQQSMHTR